MFAAVYAAEGSSFETLLGVARDFSPRVETCGPREVALDLGGLTRLFGDAKTLAGELRRTAADRGLRIRIAIAGTRTAARLLVHHRAGITIVEPGGEPAALDDLRIELLEIFRTAEPPVTITLRRWGLRTLGDLARLPADEVAARLGQDGVAWQRLARGEDPAPLVPSAPDERFEQALDLEWPIDGLEPLSFVLARLMEPLSAHLERRDRGAAVLHLRLHLVTREVHERSLQLPAPIRDARTLRTLALLDLESHPPAAAIDRVVVAVDPTPGRVIQFSLLTRPLPSPEQLSTLMARLTALMGEDRCGSAVTVDGWQPGAFEMRRFAPQEGIGDQGSGIKNLGLPIPDPRSLIPAVAVRRFRSPVPARVRVDRGIPVRVISDRRGLSGGKVETYAGPWRASGGWWIEDRIKSWERDEWDVTLSDGATYRVFRARDTDAWFIEGVVD
ncbi:MAG TPA: DNA polymerase Y family protein [Vicinamibacterales bacterium]